MKNLAIIGCGRISYKHIQAAIENQSTIKLVAVCDVIKDKAEKRGKEYSEGIYKNLEWPDGCEDFGYEAGSTKPPAVYKDYKEMLKTEIIDIVAICTESGYHAGMAIFCMNEGKHIIVEKPMALSTKDADAMIEVARENNVKLCVSHQNRFNPPIQRLRKALEEGRFGGIIAGNARILWNRGQEYYNQAPWRGTYELDGGCLMNQCIHNIDLLQWMLGSEVQWLNADVSNQMHDYIEAEDYGSIQIKFKNGAVGNVEGTICVYPKNLEETLTIIGEKGIVSIGGLAVNKIETWRFEDGKDTEEALVSECNMDIDSVYGNGHTPLYKDMIDSIENNREPYINGVEGKKAMEIILASYRSSREGKRISFPPGDIASIDFR